MKRSLTLLVCALVLTACGDGAQPLTPVADVVNPSAGNGPPLEYEPVAIELPSPYTTGLAVAINNRNQVVVSARVVNNFRWESGGAFIWHNGVLENLGTLGAAFTVPTDINERGQVVGWSWADFATEARAWFWDQGVMQDLGPVYVYPGGPTFSHVKINARGQVLGHRPGAGVGGAGGHAFLWENGVAQDLPLDFATGLNARGQVSGWVWHDSAGTRLRRAVVWEAGTVTELGTLGGADSWANAISNSGWVVGGSRTGPNEWGSSERHAFRWRDGQMEDLGRSGQMSSGRPEGWQATLVNDPGQIGAQSFDVPFFWDHGETQFVNCRCLSYYPMDLNVHGAMVGYGAYVWQNGVLHTLEGQGPRRAVAINDQGVVVGYELTQATVWLPVHRGGAIQP